VIQFYCLSVFLNIIGGYALCPGLSLDRGTPFDGMRSFLQDRTTRIVLGILAAVTGGFKLIIVVRGDIPVIGDFIPALAGLVVGTVLFLDQDTFEPEKTPSPAAPEGASVGGASDVPRRGAGVRRKLSAYLVERKAAIGFLGIGAGIAHFLFPMVVFL
jgi:hypothetical protein